MDSEQRSRLQTYEEFSKTNSIIPLNGKAPIEKNWSKWAHEHRPFRQEEYSKDGEVLNAGLVCGPASDALVLDVDDERLFRSVLRRRKWKMVKTFRVRSRKNRAHYYYRYPEDGKVYGNRSVKVLGFDIRGVGGQIVIPGSINPETGMRYLITRNCERAEPPKWLLEICHEYSTDWATPKISKLPIPKNVKRKILKGSKQKEVTRIVEYLIAAKLSDDQIFYIFYTFPVSKEFRKTKDGDVRDIMLQKLIDDVREHLPACVPTPPSTAGDKVNWDGEIENLHVSKETKAIIKDGMPKGQRSEAIMKVLDALVGAGLTDAEIFSVFENFPIGEKYREKGATKGPWLQRQIDKAKQYVKSGSSIRCIDHKLVDRVPEALSNNEKGDADLLVELCRGRYCRDHSEKMVYMWNGNLWVPDKTDSLLKEVDLVVDVYKDALSQEKVGKANPKLIEELEKRNKKLHTVHRRQSIIKLATSGPSSLGITGEEWDKDPWLLGCQNCVVDLKRVVETKTNPKTGKAQKISTVVVRESRPSYYIKTAVPTTFKGLDEKADRFEKFLSEVFQDDKDLIRHVQKILGYALLGNVEQHIFVILYGRGRNGKTTLVNTIQHVLGPLVGNIPSETLLSQKYGNTGSAPRPEIMSLRGKRVVWTSETGKQKEFDVETVKHLTGGDTITSRKLYSDLVSFKPTHTLFLLTNHKPYAEDDEYAFWERVHLIPFEVSYVDNPSKIFERKKDPHLLEDLKREASGILAWLVKGSILYQKYNLNPPSCVTKATNSYKTEEDYIGQFIKDCCEVSRGLKVKSSLLYKRYQRWITKNELSDIGLVTFGKELKKRFKCKKSSGVIYLGLAIKK